AAVVVEVAGGDAHRIAVRHDPAGLRDVGKAERARTVRVNLEVIAVQSTLQRALRWGQRFADRPLPEHLSLRHEHIEIAVAVVVEQRDAGRYDFGKIESTGDAVEGDEIEARFAGAVGEPLLRGAP